MFFLGSFSVAGIFSSRIATSTGTEVLLSSPYCGERNLNNLTSAEIYGIVQPFYTTRRINAANYAQKCYSNKSKQNDCEVYVKRQLLWTSNRRASCPFSSKDICKSDHNNLELDTGYIDSNEHLGANPSLEKRVIFRSTLKCVPLTADNYKTNYSFGGNDMEAQVTRFYFGPLLTSISPVNYTLEPWESSNAEYSNRKQKGLKQDYGIT